jgi:hypothetical protein
MNKQQAKRARVVAYICFGLAIVNVSIYVAKSLFAAGSEPSPALWITAMAMFIAGSLGLALAKKASQE